MKSTMRETYPAVMLCTHDNNKHADHIGSFLDSISHRGTSSGIQNLSQSHQKLGENQKFAFGHLGSLAAPGDLEESASHHVLNHMNIKTLKHCAPAQRNRIFNDHLLYGDVIWRQIFIFSENRQ